MEYELQDFNKDVVEASEAVPVVIDFWAEWCGPCRQLSPVLEKLAKESEGRWKLVTIDTDQNPDISSQFGIRGIPAVKMVYQKQLIAEFTGVQPEHIIRKWLEENLPSDGTDDSGEILNNIKLLLGEGKREEAKSFLARKITGDSNAYLKVMYAMLLLPDDSDEAEKWLEQIENRSKYEIEFQTLETTVRLKSINESKIEPEGENQTAIELYKEAISDLFKKGFEESIQKFIQLIQTERNVDEEGPRKACIAIFTMLGEWHPLTVKYRRQFSMALY